MSKSKPRHRQIPGRANGAVRRENPVEFTTNQRFLEGLSAHQAGDWTTAERAYREILTLDPGNADALHGIGLLAVQQGHNELGRKLIRRAVQMVPEASPFRSNLAVSMKALGLVDAAIAEGRRALAIDPTYAVARANLIFALDYHPDIPPEVAFAERLAYGRHLRRPETILPHENDRDPDRVLRVGYVSADYRDHSAAYAHGQVIGHHDKTQVHAILYSSTAVPDRVTEAFGVLGELKPVRGLSDEQLADLIREDQIDILVDLSGHSEDNRLQTFAYKPAPIQVTAWGYVMGTGVAEMDYVFGDDIVTPEGAESLFAEEIVRLPSVIPYDPGRTPDVAEPPCTRNGYVTFGYLGRPYKLNGQCLTVWAEILRQVPDARLLLKHTMFQGDTLRESVVDGLVARGVSPARISVGGGTTRYDHLAAYGDVDIALDSISQNGGITSADALWMGVPSITRPDRTVCERTTASILIHALGEHAAPYIAASLGEYVQKAVQMAAVMKEHATLETRQEFRALLKDSVICDGPLYCREIERVYRGLWHRFLAKGEAVEEPEREMAGIS